MLEIMRNQAQSWIAKVILGGIALSFGLWGVGDYFTGGRVAYLAEIDGKPITDASFSQAYERNLNNYKSILGQQFSKTLVQQLGIKDNTLQTMINRQLMLDEAARMGLVASDGALLAYVQSNPTFQQAGNFDPQRYRIFTRNMGFRNTKDYESETRVNLMIDSLQKAIMDSTHVSDTEVRAEFERQFERRSIAAIMIEPKSLLKSIKIDETAAQTWYKEHSQNYQSKLKVDLLAVVIDPAEIAKDLNIDESDIQEAYEARKKTWTSNGKTKPLAEVRNELVQTLRLNKAGEEAYQLFQDLDNALGMADSLIAAADSLGLSTQSIKQIDSNGALANSLLNSDRSLLQQAFSILPGEAINILELNDGRFVALESTQRTAPKTLSFSEVSSSVYRDASQAEAIKKAQSQARDIIANAQHQKPDDIAQASGYAKFLSKPLRSNGTGDDASWITASIVNTAFHTPAGQWASKAVPTSQGLAVVYVVKRISGDQKVFDKEKASLAIEAAKAKGAVRFARWMATVRDRHEIVIHNQVLEQI
ncbi:MAG: peptidylprolyl isomerase [Mariprofundaceae bacterium]